MRAGGAFVALLLLAGCDHPTLSAGPAHRLDGGASIQTDPETGCQYVVTVDGGVFPRLNSEGEPMCAHNSGVALRPAIEAETIPGDVQ